MRERVRCREQRPVRVRHERDVLRAEMTTHLVEVLDLALHDEPRRVLRQLRATGAALIVEDDHVRSASGAKSFAMLSRSTPGPP